MQVKNRIVRTFSSLTDSNTYQKTVKTLKITGKYLAKYSGLQWLSQRYRKLPNKRKKMIIGYLFILPWLIGLYLFGVRPLYDSIRMSFADSASYVLNVEKQVAEFVVKGLGFTQYQKIFKENPEHVEIILKFFQDILLVVPIVLVFSLILALMLNQEIKGRSIFRVIFFMPVILLSGSMLNTFNQYGLLTVPIITSGQLARVINTYLPPIFARIIVGIFDKVVLYLWLSGVQTLIFLAGLQKMNREVYEAAEIDGASAWESFWKITLPNLIPLMIINIIYTTVIYSNISSNPFIDIIRSTITDIKYGRAYSSALAWILFLTELTVILIYTLILKIASKRYN